MFTIYEIFIFTETSKAKPDAILDHILGDNAHYITHRLYRDSCGSEIDGKLVKDVSSLGQDIRKVIIMDNCVFRYSFPPCNTIPIKNYANRDSGKVVFLFVCWIPARAAKKKVFFQNKAYQDWIHNRYRLFILAFWQHFDFI